MLPLLDARFYGIVRPSPEYDQQMSVLMREARLLHANPHANVVAFVGLVHDLPPPPTPPGPDAAEHEYGRCTWLVMEMAEFGSLHHWMLHLRRDRVDPATATGNPELLSLAEVLLLFADMWSGLAHLHSSAPPLMHRDLKPANMLVCRRPSRAAAARRCVASQCVLQRAAEQHSPVFAVMASADVLCGVCGVW